MPKNLFRRLASLLVVGVTASAIVAGTSGTAAAYIPMCPTDNFCMYEFYDSAEMTNPVGRTFVNCDFTSEHEGRTTPWVQMWAYPCA